MRVISGSAKGHHLKAPRGLSTRPTADHVRQAIFDILGPTLGGARVLDLYAGSGAMAIEALSRGAAHAMLVEKARSAVAVIRDNLAVTKMADRATVVADDVPKVLGRGTGHPFDLILIDPPYDAGLASLGRVLAALSDGGWVAPGATVVVEAATGAVPWPPGFTPTRSRTFGRTQVSVAVADA